ncbi:MAG: hypothetical protein JWN73_363 [Betaproteobacteria bacterium]|nr:hypothetical protein [Betaproteobacteria bacterium]
MLRKLFGNSAAAAGAAAPARASFLPYYEQTFAPLLADRTSGFRMMFELLEARCRGLSRPALIVETGSLRAVGNWSGDGQSTRLWKEFAAFQPCEIHTVDLDPGAAPVVRAECGDAVQAHTGDSVAFLYKMAQSPEPPQIDLLYLDSYDFDVADPFPSAFHHIKELIAVRPCLGPGSIVAIDDNYPHPDPADGRVTGKGYLAMQWFRDLDIPLLHRGLQFVWQL